MQDDLTPKEQAALNMLDLLNGATQPPDIFSLPHLQQHAGLKEPVPAPGINDARILAGHILQYATHLLKAVGNDPMALDNPDVCKMLRVMSSALRGAANHENEDMLFLESVWRELQKGEVQA